MKTYKVNYKFSAGETHYELHKKVNAANEVEAIEDVQDQITEKLLRGGYQVNNTIETLDVYTPNCNPVSTYFDFTAKEI